MSYKKMFLPIGGGNELKERIYGALLVAKYFKVHLEILATIPNLGKQNRSMLSENIIKELQDFMYKEEKEQSDYLYEIIKKTAQELDVVISNQALKDSASVSLNLQRGVRSEIVENESKFCDLVVAAVPPNGVATATFEASVMESGKPAIVIPRTMTKFDTKSCIIGWNGSREISSAITSALSILKKAQKVLIVSSEEYMDSTQNLEKLQNYLSLHGISAETKITETTRVPGEAFFKVAVDGKFDLMVAGAIGNKGLKEMFFGGATKYLLEKTTIPIFMSY